MHNNKDTNNINRKEYIESILQLKKHEPVNSVEVFCPINIALIKYWGKKNSELMLPFNASISISLNNLGTKTSLSISKEDCLILDSKIIKPDSLKFKRVFDYLHLICGYEFNFCVNTQNNIPISAGLASSASAFSSFAMAINQLFDFKLDKINISKLARMGSISAARSIHSGFVLLENQDDCYAKQIKTNFNDLYIGFCILSDEEKKYTSSENMNYTVLESVFYESWLNHAKRDLEEIIPHIQSGDFYKMGLVAERNALSMHASISMLNQEDRCYLKKESLTLIKRVQSIRKDGLPIFCTMDAGPNVKIIFQQNNLEKVMTLFPEMTFFEKIF